MKVSSPAGTLQETEPHPAAFNAKQWLQDYFARQPDPDQAAMILLESFASTGMSGNRLGEICAETLRRLMQKEPVSDRYLLGLCWTIHSMDKAAPTLTATQRREAALVVGEAIERSKGGTIEYGRAAIDAFLKWMERV